MSLLLPIFGTLFLLFRVWLCEIKLHSILGNKRAHTSRFISYYFGLAMILNFEVNVFTLIALVSSPAMILALFFFDFPFFWNDCRNSLPHKSWQIIERLTMHLPLIIFGVGYYILAPAVHYFQLFTLPHFIIAILLAGIPMVGFDPRLTKKEDWPRGPFIFGGALVDIIGNIIFFIYLGIDRGYFQQVGINVALGLG